MCDNRLGMLHVIRSVVTSKGAHGHETVQTRFQRARSTASAWHADARARGDAGGRSPRMRGKPADGIDLGEETSRGSASVAAPAARTSGFHGHGTTQAAQQDADRRRYYQWLPDRGVDARAYRHTDQARVWPRVWHHARVADRARAWVFEPAADRTRLAARRASHQGVEDQALASAKKRFFADLRGVKATSRSPLLSWSCETTRGRRAIGGRTRHYCPAWRLGRL